MADIALKEQAAIVNSLQDLCKKTFETVTRRLRTGMSEADIAEALKAYMLEQGVTNHWYDVPFIVLIGLERFKTGIVASDYAVKAPQKNVYLQEGDTIHIDFSPMDPRTQVWGDWSTTCIFHPQTSYELALLQFLDEMRALQREGIKNIEANSTGADVAKYYVDAYTGHGAVILDVRNNVGHTMHAGPKTQTSRIWLDAENTNPLGVGIFTVEPGGTRLSDNAVARFEECIYIPEEGHAIILGSDRMVSLAV